MRLAATGLLAGMAALYVATCLWPHAPSWLGYVRAFAEAATVGACADWFAVTALFRRPLGLPIPHTGIIPRNKDRIGAALGAFIADNFLTQEVLEARLRQLEVGRWGADWLRRPENAAGVAERIVRLIPELLDLSSAEARRRFVGGLAADLVVATPAAPFAAGLLRAISSGVQRTAILDAGLGLLARALEDNKDLVRAEVAGRTYRWLPRWIDDRIADTLIGGLSRTLAEMQAPDHPWRERVGAHLDDFIARLETDPTLAARVEAIKLQLADHPALRARLGELGDVLEARLHPTTEAEAAALRDQIATWLAAAGAWLFDQGEAIEIFNAWARLALERMVAPRRHDIGRAIAGVVASWDARSVVEKLELQVGPDLQFIRISGTIVGGLVGLAIFAATQLLGGAA
jgi:uncharacterized membrane-anchored protein YjiN (DUF445 family)